MLRRPSWVPPWMLRGSVLAAFGTFSSFGVGFGAAIVYREIVFGWMSAPASNLLSPHGGGLPVFTTPTEPLTTTVKVAWHSGMVVAFGPALLSTYFGVRKYLNKAQRRSVQIYIPVIIGMFLAGNAFAYFVILPAAIRWLIGFSDGIAIATIRLSEYTALVSAMVFWMGVLYQIPLVMFVLSRRGVVSHDRFTKLDWRIPFMFALVFSGLITPTFDIFNLMLVFVPIYALWRVGLYATWLAESNHAEWTIRAITRLFWFFTTLAVLYVLARVLFYMVVEYGGLPR